MATYVCFSPHCPARAKHREWRSHRLIRNSSRGK